MTEQLTDSETRLLRYLGGRGGSGGRTGAPAGGDLLRTLAGARGNPFLVVDLLAGLREENLVRVVDGRAGLAEKLWAREHEAGVIVYSPMTSGLLTGTRGR
jgi:hypothetical protein